MTVRKKSKFDGTKQKEAIEGDRERRLKQFENIHEAWVTNFRGKHRYPQGKSTVDDEICTICRFPIHECVCLEDERDDDFDDI